MSVLGIIKLKENKKTIDNNSTIPLKIINTNKGTTSVFMQNSKNEKSNDNNSTIPLKVNNTNKGTISIFMQNSKKNEKTNDNNSTISLKINNINKGTISVLMKKCKNNEKVINLINTNTELCDNDAYTLIPIDCSKKYSSTNCNCRHTGSTNCICGHTGINNCICGPTVSNNCICGNTGINNDLDKYLIKPPIAPIFGIPVSTSTAIFIPFTPPSQQLLGSLGYVPLINSITIQYNCKTNLSSPIISRNILNNVSGQEYYSITGLTPYPNINQVTGIVLIKASSILLGNTNVISGQIYSLYFPQDNNGSFTSGITRKALVYTDTTIQNIVSQPLNNINIYYKNYSPDVNIGIVYFDIFISSGVPSVPLNLSLSGLNYSSAIISYSSPQYGDSSNPNTNTPIENYKIEYSSIDNLISYTQFIPINNSIIFTGIIDQLTGLYPDTMYSTKVSAKNILNINYGPQTTPINFTTMELTNPSHILLSSLNFSVTNYSAKKVSDNSSISNLILSNDTISSLPFTYYINETSSRGKLGIGNIMSLKVVISSMILLFGPEIYFTGFPAVTPPGSSFVNDLQIIPSNVSDYTTNIGYTGYYLSGSGVLKLNTSSLTATDRKYIVSLIRRGVTTQTQTYEFYYDDNNLVPIIGNISFTINTTLFNGVSGSYAKVNGVNIVFGNVIIESTVSDISNIGRYFYNASQIISYYDTNNNFLLNEINLNNVTSGKTSSYLRNGQITVTNNNIPYTIPQAYRESFTLNVKAHNISDQTTSLSNTIPIIFDYPSYRLVYLTLPQLYNNSILGSSSPGLSGYRCWIKPVINTLLPDLPQIFYTNTIPYSSIIYDNSVDISIINSPYDYSQELQISNGKFVTKSSAYGYKNYNNYYYDNNLRNTVNYSTISATGYRYANFSWKSPTPNFSSVFSNLFINMTETNVQATYLNGSVYADSLSSKIIQLYYRFEDDTGLTPSASTNSSYWINGNTTNGPTVGSGNYYISGLTCNGGGYSPVLSSNNILFKLKLPNNINTTNANNITIYVRVGLPQDIDFSFGNILGYLQ